MKNNKYSVKLKGLTVVVQAFNESQAIILAQAEAIKVGANYEFVSISDKEYNNKVLRMNYLIDQLNFLEVSLSLNMVKGDQETIEAINDEIYIVRQDLKSLRKQIG